MSLSFSHVQVPTLASVYYEDGRLADVGGDYTSIARPKRRLWSNEEKQVLYILNQFYDNDSAELWKVFDAYFAERYKRLPKPRPTAWESMKSYNASPLRYRVLWDTATTERLKAKLEEKAATIGIDLRMASQIHSKAQLPLSRRRQFTPSISSTSESDGGWDSDKSEAADAGEDLRDRKAYDQLQTPRVQRYKEANGLLTPPASINTRGNRRTRLDRPVPPIAFRAFNSQSQGLNGADGFVAGSFVGRPLSAIPDHPNKDHYLRDLERHLGREHSGVTPFISVCQKLLRVFVHALRRCRKAKEGDSKDWNIAVISLAKVSSSVRAVWDLDAGVHSRKALGEWVAPFHVDIIKRAENTLSARKAMASPVKRRLTYDDGVAFGQLMLSLSIPARHLDYLCTVILADWWYPESKGEAWLANQDFVQGRDEAYYKTPHDFRTIESVNETVNQFEEQNCPNEDERSPFSTSATNQDRCDTDEWFAEFLKEVEEVAFGAGSARSNDEFDNVPKDDPQHRTILKEESPDCIMLDAVPEYLKSSTTSSYAC
ncbi:MAG: hypothetical protein Q9225_005536 [Loekoesia sp. 1 TL-2023]